MDTTIIELSARGLALVPVTLAVVSLIKFYSGSFGEYIAPITSVIVGGVLCYVVGGVTVLDSQILGGLIVGLMASGLYAGGKKLVTG